MSHDQDPALEAERARRIRETWRSDEPSSAEIAAARRRIAGRRVERRQHVVPYAAALAAVAAAILVGRAALRAPPPRIEPVAEPAVLAPAPPALAPPPAPPPEAVRDAARLAAAEALHRSGHCREARPTLEELAASGATDDIRAKARAILAEIPSGPRR